MPIYPAGYYTEQMFGSLFGLSFFFVRQAMKVHETATSSVERGALRLIEIETDSARPSQRTFIARSAIIRFSVTVDFTARANSRSSDMTKLRSERFMDFSLGM